MHTLACFGGLCCRAPFAHPLGAHSSMPALLLETLVFAAGVLPKLWEAMQRCSRGAPAGAARLLPAAKEACQGADLPSQLCRIASAHPCRGHGALVAQALWPLLCLPHAQPAHTSAAAVSDPAATAKLLQGLLAQAAGQCTSATPQMSDLLSPGRLHLEAVAVASAPLLVLSEQLWDRGEVRCALHLAAYGSQPAAWQQVALAGLGRMRCLRRCGMRLMRIASWQRLSFPQ